MGYYWKTKQNQKAVFLNRVFLLILKRSHFR